MIVSILERQLVDILGKQIAVQTGVMQGSPLSPKLFTFVVDTAISDCQILTTMTVSRNLFAYADDLATTLKNKAHAKEIMVAMDSLKSEKLFVNMSKTELLTADVGIEEAAAEMGIKAVKKFCYLRVEIRSVSMQKTP